MEGPTIKVFQHTDPLTRHGLSGNGFCGSHHMTTKTDKKFLAWSTKPEDIEIVRSEGSFLYDTKGEKYIDFIMGWCVGNYGWGNEEIFGVIHNFKGPAYVYPSFLYKPWTELASLLAKITPGKLNKCFRAAGGTDSIETALKIAMVYTGRKKFLSVEGSYHGNSIGALSIGAGERKVYPNLLEECYKIHRPLDQKAILEAEKLLRQKDVAAFVMEPILTHPGIHIPDKNFMTEIRRLCTKYGTLLIIDEVATGFGRTGKLFGSEYYELEPDIMCMAKALSGGYAAIGAAITTEKIGASVEEKIHAYPTYGWHPLSVQAAIASIHYMLSNKQSILKNVNDLNKFFRHRISNMSFKEEIEVNMIGLVIAIDVKKSSYAEKITNRCLKNKLLIEFNGTNLMMFPALNMNLDVANEGLDILENSI